ncbi:MAG: biotin/lipoyl-binding protein, partial [Anaerolineae bacterium]
MRPLWHSLWVTLALVTVMLTSTACSSQTNVEDQESSELVTVERGDIATRISATGSVYPKDEVKLSFDVGGRVSETQVRTGDTVQEGDLLASLETADLELQVRSAEAGLAAAQAQLAQLQEGPQPEEIAVAEGQLAAAEAALSQAVAARDQLQAGTTQADIAAAQAQVAAAMAEQKA